MAGTLSSWTICCVSYLINEAVEVSLTTELIDGELALGVVDLRLQIYTMLAQPYVARHWQRSALSTSQASPFAPSGMHSVITYQSEGGSLFHFR
jgi:hypothetical protein